MFTKLALSYAWILLARIAICEISNTCRVSTLTLVDSLNTGNSRLRLIGINYNSGIIKSNFNSSSSSSTFSFFVVLYANLK